jgi:hypothetical protein
MINPGELHSFIDAAPFEPFRIQMARGRSFEVRHPEMAEVGRMTMLVYSTVSDGNRLREQRHKISLLLIECIEPLQGARV